MNTTKEVVIAEGDAERAANFIKFYSKEPYIWLSGPGISLIRQIGPERKPKSDVAWRQEIAMEAGMAFGCDGYNDAMGYY